MDGRLSHWSPVFFIKERKMAKEEKTIDERIKEKYGDEKIFKISSGNNKYNPKDFISTGSKNLNDLISGDSKIGIPRGKIIEIYGEEGTWKSTIALHITAEFNKKGNPAAYIDAEHAMNPTYAIKIGVNPNITLFQRVFYSFSKVFCCFFILTLFH